MDFTDSLPNSNVSRGGVVRMVAKPRPPAPLPVRMVKEERENLLPVRLPAKSREEREERAPVRMIKEEREEKAPIRMGKEEKENQAPHFHPTRFGENVRAAEKKEELQPRSNTGSLWSRKQDELQVQIQHNRRKSQEFEERSKRSEESLSRVGERYGNLKREEKMMSDDLARVKVEQSHRRDENRALGLRERLEHLSGGGGEPPAASLTKTTSCPASASPHSLQPQSLQSSQQQQHHYQPVYSQEKGQPQPQSLPRRDDPRNLLVAPVPATARSLLQTPLPSKPQPMHSYRTPAPNNQAANQSQAPPVASTSRDPTMPPPSMAISQQKEQILVVRGKRYRVMKLLGKGGSSRVYEAFDELRNQVVAIKRVNLEEADDETTRGYINEIGMLEKLQGEDRIVRLFDHETVEEDNVLYVIMEKGDTDLASLLKKYVNKEVNILLLRSELNL